MSDESVKKQPSTSARGAYYKNRSRVWLTEQGYQVADMEMIRWMHPGPGRAPVPLKKDQFASDLLAVSATEIIFVQVKSGKIGSNEKFLEARRAFEKFQFPPGTKRWVLAWVRGARAPRVVDMDLPPQKTTLF